MGSLHVVSAQMTKEGPEKLNIYYPLYPPLKTWSPPLLCWHYLIYHLRRPQIPLQMWNMCAECLLNMVAYKWWEYSLFFLICHCENSEVMSLPLITKDGLYLSLYIMPVPTHILSSLEMFLKQYPTFINSLICSCSHNLPPLPMSLWGKRNPNLQVYSGVILSLHFH